MEKSIKSSKSEQERWLNNLKKNKILFCQPAPENPPDKKGYVESVK